EIRTYARYWKDFDRELRANYKLEPDTWATIQAYWERRASPSLVQSYIAARTRVETQIAAERDADVRDRPEVAPAGDVGPAGVSWLRTHAWFGTTEVPHRDDWRSLSAHGAFEARSLKRCTSVIIDGRRNVFAADRDNFADTFIDARLDYRTIGLAIGRV